MLFYDSMTIWGRQRNLNWFDHIFPPKHSQSPLAKPASFGNRDEGTSSSVAAQLKWTWWWRVYWYPWYSQYCKTMDAESPMIPMRPRIWSKSGQQFWSKRIADQILTPKMTKAIYSLDLRTFCMICACLWIRLVSFSMAVFGAFGVSTLTPVRLIGR